MLRVIIVREGLMPFLGTWIRLGVFVSALLLPVAVFGEKPKEPVEMSAAGWDYAAYMGYALTHSPHLSKTSLEFKIRRLDEDDSRSEMLPEVSFHAGHYVSEGTRIGLIASAYHPFTAYYSMKVRQILSEIAKLQHASVLSEAHYTVAQQFFRYAAFSRMILVQRELIVQAEKKAAYIQNRRQAGAVSQLDVRIANQELAVRAAELKSLEVRAGAIRDMLTRFIDGDPDRPVVLNTEKLTELLTSFSTDTDQRDRMLALSPAIKIARYREALQRYHIRLAYAAYLPTFSMEFRQPDIVDEPHENDFVFSVGARISLWDGGKRRRDIARQKVVMEQVETETWLQKNALIDRWHSAVQEVDKASAELSLAVSGEALSALKLSQTQLLYEQDKASMAGVYDDSISFHVARKNRISTQLADELARLLVYHLSGRLFEGYIDAIDFQDTPDDIH